MSKMDDTVSAHSLFRISCLFPGLLKNKNYKKVDKALFYKHFLFQIKKLINNYLILNLKA